MKINELVCLFQTKCPELVKELKNSDHHFSSEHLNVYHQEGDCYTHTQMVMLQSHIFKVNPIVAISALLHDSGKPMAREEVPERQRVRYLGHEGYSIFKSLDCIQQMGLSFSHDELTRIMNLISHHTTLYKVFETSNPIQTVVNKFKGNRALLDDLIWLSKCDALGRFTSHENTTAENLENILKPALDALYDNTEVINKGPTATVLVGPPLSGKSSWVRKNLGDSVLLCRDDILMSMGKSSNYAENWREADQDAINKEFNRQKEEAIKSGRNVVFDLTNCSPKSRRSSFGSIPKEYQKKAVVFYTGYDEIMKRNEIRYIEEQKYIKPEVIHQFMMGFTSPLYDEVDVVESVFSIKKTE